MSKSARSVRLQPIGGGGYVEIAKAYRVIVSTGGVETVDGITVVWPSGTRQEVTGPLETNRLLEIVEPER